MEPVRIASPAAGDAQELIVDARGARGERPLSAQRAELDQRAALGRSRIEAPREAPKALGVHVLGALGVAHGEAPARAEREPRRGEPGGPRDGEDEGRLGGHCGEARNEGGEAVLVHPALLDPGAPPAHVRDGEGVAVRAREHDRARAGAPRKRPSSRRSAPALLGAGPDEHRPLGLGDIAERAVEHRIDDPVRGERFENAPGAGRACAPRLRNGLPGILVHRHGVGTGVVEHRAGGAPGVGARAMDEMARGVGFEERDRIERHRHGATASSAALRGSW